MSWNNNITTIIIILMTLSIADDDKINYISYRSLGSGQLYNNELIEGLEAVDFSGITYNPLTCSYFMISDECCTDDKGFYGIDLNGDLNEFTVLQGIQMDRDTDIGIDTEGIAFINDEDNAYYIIAQEGYRQFSTSSTLFLYDTNGTYIKSLIDQVPNKFLIDNLDDNKGIEGLAIDKEQEYLVFSSELSLINDRSICENCVRISVNDISINRSTDDIVVIDELYELRYDLDTTIIPNAEWALSDIVVFQNNDKLYGLVLERLTIVIDADLDLENYDNKIYLVDLTLDNSMYDIKDQTINVTAIEKTLLFTFSTDVDSTIFTPPVPVCTNTQCLNFETLTILYDEDSDDGMVNLVAINDNGGLIDTFFVFLEWDASSIFGSSASTSYPQTTVIDDVEYETIEYGTIENGLLIQELSGITYNSIDNTYYAVSDEFISNKGFYGFNIATGDSVTLQYGDMILMDDPDIDSEGIIFIKNTYDEGNSYFLVASEGNTDYNTSNRLLLYSVNNGTFLTEITDQLPDRFTIDNTENNRGIKAFTIDETQQSIVYTTESALISENVTCGNCVRISVNSFSIDQDDDDDDITITEDYQLRYDIDQFSDTDIPSCIPLSDPNAYIGITDISVFRDNSGSLYGLILERMASGRCSGLVYDARVYLVDLNQDSGQDVSGCESLSEAACEDIEAIDKKLVFTFSEDVKDATLREMVKYLNFEILSIVYNDDGSVLSDDNIINLVAVNDNSNIGQSTFDTYFVYFSIDISEQIVTTKLPVTCEDLTESVCKLYPLNCVWDTMFKQCITLDIICEGYETKDECNEYEDECEYIGEECLPIYTTTDDPIGDEAHSVFAIGIYGLISWMLIFML